MKEKQDTILLAAIDLFAEKGFAAATTSEIAKKAGVAEGTIYRYFSTKKDLLLAVPDYVRGLEISSRFLADMEKACDESLEQFLRVIVRNRNAFAANNVKILKVMLQETAYHPELFSRMRDLVLMPAVRNMTEAIRHFQARGELPDRPVQAIVNLIFTSIFGFMFVRHVLNVDLNWGGENETELLVQFVKNGLCAKGEE